MDKILTIKNLGKKFDKKPVLYDVSFDVGIGETIAIIGSSGSGKSTLLRILCGLEKADSGSIIGETKDIGFIFQDFNLFPHLTARGNITLALRNVKKTRQKEAKKTATRVLGLVGLTGCEKKYPCQLSGGMKQRVAIARALALEPKILCFDEPTSALDPELTVEVLKVIKNLKQNGYTQIIVTHEINFAENIADKVIFIDNGKIAEIGTAEIITKSQTERLKKFLEALTL